MCGEYLLSPSIWCVMLGSSSLVRGIRGRNGTKGLLDRIIPACAGNTSYDGKRIQIAWDHPRLCGEYLRTQARNKSGVGSSPLVRGILRKQLPFIVTSRIIPACAGNTRIRKLVDHSTSRIIPACAGNT